MRIQFTLGGVCPSSGLLKDACGLPFSAVLEPLAVPADGLPLCAAAGPAPLPLLARCRHCYAYINRYCELSGGGFTCSLCGKTTSLGAGQVAARYLKQPMARDLLPELACSVYEVDVGDADDSAAAAAASDARARDAWAEGAAAGGGNSGGGGGGGCAAAFLAVVDAAGDEEFLELVRGALLSALDALPQNALFGLVTFSDRIGLWDVRGGAPLVRCVPVLEGLPPLADLEDVLPLAALLAPVGEFKERLSQALELISTEVPLPRPGPLRAQGMDRNNGAGRGPGGGEGAGEAPCRALGPALQALFDYVGGNRTAGASGGGGGAGGASPLYLGQLNLMLMISGPSDIGPGRTLFSESEEAAYAAASPTRNTGGGARPGEPASGPGAAVAEGRAFYEQAAVAAASVGACVDVFAVAGVTVGLQLLEPLVTVTGGCIFLYPSAESASLPQDLVRRLASSRAYGGLLRLRASPALRAARCYGRAYADRASDQLYHVPGADSATALVIDLENASGGGLDQSKEALTRPVYVQAAYQYTRVVATGPALAGRSTGSLQALPAAAERAAGGGGGGGGLGAAGGSAVSLGSMAGGGARRFELQRRLRVATFRLTQAHAPSEVYASADADATLAALTHKISRAVAVQGVHHARPLLRDWLVIFAANYHRNMHPRASAQELLQLPVDLSFARHPALAPLPRAVYALLRSPLLSPAAQAHPDLTAYLHHLWGGLPPKELARAIYPELTAWAGADTLLASGLNLSKSSLLAAPPAAAGGGGAGASAAAKEGGPAAAGQGGGGGGGGVQRAADVWVLDAYILILVLYRRGLGGGSGGGQAQQQGPPPGQQQQQQQQQQEEEDEQPWAPPASSALWQKVARTRQARRVTPHVEVVAEGSEGSQLFESLLIDDPDPDEAEEPPQPQQSPGRGSPAPPAPQLGGRRGFEQHVRAEVAMQLQPE